MLNIKETLQFNVKLFHLYPAFKKQWDDGSPPPKCGGEKTPHFSTLHLYICTVYNCINSGLVCCFFFSPHITVLLSFHTTRKIILHQCKRTAKHLQAMILIRLLQCAEIKIILFTCHLQMQVFLSQVHLCEVLEWVFIFFKKLFSFRQWRNV